MIEKLLIKEGVISTEDLNYALEIKQKNPSKRLLDILYELNLISKEDFLKYLSKELNIDYILSIKSFSLPNIQIPLNILKQTLSIPIEITLEKVIIASSNPLNWGITSTFKRFFKDKKIEFVLAHKEDIEKVVKILESQEKFNRLKEKLKKELSAKSVSSKESSVMQLIKFIITQSIYQQASDIHIEPLEDFVKVRIRIFGSLFEKWELEYEIYDAVVSRIKLEAGMNVSEKRKPQDGSFSMSIDNNNFDFRISTLPIIFGESIVIRILDKRNIVKNIEELGLNKHNLSILKKILHKSNGMFLVTGPTGSGKTTTLYAALNKIFNQHIKVITVEDPVEYKFRGIQQVQVNKKFGITFANALRSILRQDPDIIMVGEIRDIDTLEIAIKASLTGHLVLATLHTNDALSTINRMLDMGVPSYMVAASLAGVEAQRLIKKICPYCKVAYKPKEIYLEPIKDLLPKDVTFYKGVGCEKCNMTGYIGRSLISEIFIVDEVLESLISQNKDKAELLEYLTQKGFKTMFYDGLEKVFKGLTSLEEVYRVSNL